VLSAWFVCLAVTYLDPIGKKDRFGLKTFGCGLFCCRYVGSDKVADPFHRMIDAIKGAISY
jgi:hypothetical protein